MIMCLPIGVDGATRFVQGPHRNLSISGALTKTSEPRRCGSRRGLP
jgi:hypothetical protein